MPKAIYPNSRVQNHVFDLKIIKDLPFIVKNIDSNHACDMLEIFQYHHIIILNNSRCSHALVKKLSEAQEILDLVNNGEKFGALCKKRSIDIQ